MSMSAVERDCAIIAAVIKNAVSGTNVYKVPNSWQSTRVTWNYGAVYSYGTHFPLAEVYRHRGRRPLILLNGDRWGGSRVSRTGAHQAHARQVAESLADVADSLIIPFSAIDGAGIDHRTIRPLHVRADTNATFYRSCEVPRDYLPAPVKPWPNDAEAWTADSSIVRASTRTDSVTIVTRGADAAMVRAGIPETETRSVEVKRVDTWRRYDYSWKDGNGGAVGWRNYDPPQTDYFVGGLHATATLTDAGTIRLTWSTDAHWLGDSLFLADRIVTTVRPCPDHKPGANGSWCDTCGLGASGTGRITTQARKRGRFLSSFDYNERMPLYFLAALPRSSRARTVESAFDDLAPRAVHAAYARGIDVQRQGDIFAIATPLTTAEVYARSVRRAFLSAETHGRIPRRGEVGYRAPFTPRQRATMARERRRLFLDLQRAHEERTREAYHKRYPWRAEKRRKVRELRATIARHRARIAAGADTCQCDTCYNDGDGGTCERCKLPRYWYRYTAENAAEQLPRVSQTLATLLATSRAPRRDRAAMASKAIRVWNPADGANLTDGNRARVDWLVSGERIETRYRVHIDHAPIRRTLAIYGTAHTATEVVITKGGTTYVRGILRHRPDLIGERRDADHSPVTLGDGKTWYLAVRNTVPRQ